jgi:hypothetical protein
VLEAARLADRLGYDLLAVQAASARPGPKPAHPIEIWLGAAKPDSVRSS